MKVRILYVFFVFLLGAIACQNQPKEQEETYTKEETQAQDALWDQVMAIHDEVMPEVGKINALTEDLKPYMENPELDKSKLEEVNNSLKALETGEESMFSWMNALKQLGALRNDKSHEEIMNYLRGELSNMENVKQTMMKSISGAEQLLAKLQEKEQ